MLHGVVVSMKKFAIEITGIPVDEYAAEIEDGDGAMGRHETNSNWSLYADRVKASACGFSRKQAWLRRVADSRTMESQGGCRITVSQFSRSDQVRLGGIISCSRMPFLYTVVFCRKALFERRDQRALELWLLGKS
jgi:hypothetical protein